MEPSTLLAVAAFVLTLFGTCFTAFKYVSAQIDRSREAALALAERVAQQERVSRQELAQQLGTGLAAVATRIERLESDAVRRHEISKLEDRVTSALGKLEVKFDRLAESFGRIGGYEVLLKNVSDRLDSMAHNNGSDR